MEPVLDLKSAYVASSRGSAASKASTNSLPVTGGMPGFFARSRTRASAAAKQSLVPPRWQDSVREISISEARAAGLALSHAFASDDLCRYLLEADDMAHHTAEKRWNLHVVILTGVVAAHCYKGIVATIGPDYDAVALWMPPGKDFDGWWTVLRSGMWKPYWKLSREGRRRYYRELIPLLDETKAEVMGDRDDDCYYLVYLGTKPSSRGRGYASKLLGDMTARADAENRAIYLESSSESNNSYYAKFGFEIRRDVYLGHGTPATASPGAPANEMPPPVRLTIMVREPQPSEDR